MKELMFILTTEGSEVWINPDHVVALERARQYTTDYSKSAIDVHVVDGGKEPMFTTLGNLESIAGQLSECLGTEDDPVEEIE